MNIESSMTYRTSVVRDHLDGGYVAACPSLPGCFGQGETEEEALRDLAAAMMATFRAELERRPDAELLDISATIRLAGSQPRQEPNR